MPLSGQNIAQRTSARPCPPYYSRYTFLGGLMNVNDIDRAAPLRRADPRELGGYRLLGRLGSGGMGIVYLARDPAGTLVAVKMVHSVLAGDDEFRRRFRGEVQRARQVPPFCTAEVLDADPDHEPPYLVVEYVDGPSLGEAVERGGPLTPANVHAVAIGVASALTAIHGAGVIHRDLKPRNVLLAPGSPKVIDFGIARAFEGASQYTRTGQMVGTLAYMAPERFDDSLGAAVSPAADVFAWGAVVTYAATGRTPFEGGSPTVLATRILTEPPDLAGLPAPLGMLVRHALEKHPADRPTARELLDLLLDTGAQRSALAIPPPVPPFAVPAAAPAPLYADGGRQGVAPPPRHRPPRRGGSGGRRTVLVQALALALLVAGLVGGGLALRHDAGAGAEQAAPPSAPPSPRPAAAPARPAPGPVGSATSDLCLDVFNSQTTDGTPVQMWDCNGGANQEWTWAADGTLRSLDRCLTVGGGAGSDGAPVRLSACDDSARQQWRFTAGQDIVNPEADKCLDIVDRSTEPGARVQLWACGGTANQKWRPAT
ncbi:serine/threonine protein kinase [Spirilliplanes yamanashiensis]|uniref:serine/threonine protein kinase n=1 Tax=Spirilliplanes yamanashiensis TaxID=42233 RepID=UPI0027888ABF|nr:serine/threonine protein kinase [Spirilliplanes yamanashiensis]MDP9815135.1 putative Ser/Thr protein kinase [Spirilliplanes yamanashiensis]